MRGDDLGIGPSVDGDRHRPAAGNGLLAELDFDDRKAVLAVCRPFTAQAGAIVRDRNDEPSEAILPTAGVLAALWITPDGRSVETGLIGREGMTPSFVEAEALASRRRILALTDVEGWSIGLEPLRALVAERAGLRAVVQRYGARIAGGTEARLAEAALHSTDRRLAGLLMRLHARIDGDDLAVTQDLLARLVGAQRTTINEVVKKLQDRGVIRYSRGRITILNRGALEQAGRGLGMVAAESAQPSAGAGAGPSRSSATRS